MPPSASHTSEILNVDGVNQRVTSTNDNRWLSPKVCRLLTPWLFIIGIQAWLILGGGNYGHRQQPLLLLIAVMLGSVPPVNRFVNRIWIAVARPSGRTRLGVALTILLIAPFFLYATERHQGIAIRPTYHDEFSYLIQMRMLQQGRLWMPAHPCANFFDTFYMFVKPVYASMYFPGAAMMFVPTFWLHLPWVVGPLAVSGACVALVYLVLTETLDGASGLLGAFMLVSLGMFRMISIMAMANSPALALGLLMTYATLRWIAARRTGWLIVLGLAAGWSAITRPADGVCFAIATGSAIAMDLRLRNARLWMKTLGVIVLAALPFLLFQLWVNHNIVGEWFKTPFSVYNDQYCPGAFSFHHEKVVQHVSDLPEKQLFYDTFTKGVIQSHRFDKIFRVILSGEFYFVSHLPIIDPFIWLIVPFSLLAMWKKSYWTIWAIVPVSLIVLSGFAFSTVLPHYFILTFPAVIFLCLLPIRFLTDTFPIRAPMIRAVLTFGILLLCGASMPWFDALQMDRFFTPRELQGIDRKLATEVTAPAIVMFHFNRDTLIDGRRVSDDPSEEPVYNVDVAWPDDAPVIRAHDLNPNLAAIGKPGDVDLPLYSYFARTAPNRVFYLYDRAGGIGKLKRLGLARDLVKAVTAGFRSSSG
jgi:hypothetical protein